MTIRSAICISLLVGAAVFGLSRLGGSDVHQQRLSGIPATLALNANVHQSANGARGMVADLMSLGRRYGFRAFGDPSTPQEPEWSVLIKCRDEVVALVHTDGKGRVIMGTLLIYGFKDRRDYGRFKDEFVGLFEQYGEVSEVKNGEILSDGELALRADHIGADFASRCSPPPVAASGASAKSESDLAKRAKHIGQASGVGAGVL